ncbi:DUF6252 family protein [Jejudonia soesokkakensis]|uniref:DUF6252 family protein n=1 Tax=Jejudonia soesokkakensis TaxID=1323432 RepID=A0ABW2MP20_9FLAO
MKNLKRIALTFFVSVAMIACKSDDDAGSGGNAGNGKVQAKVNGSDFESNRDFTVANQSSSGSSTTVTIQGSDNDGKGIVLVINGFEGEGSYDIGGSNTVFVVATYVEANASNPMNSQTWSAPFDSTVAGEVNVTSVTSSKIEGTFNFNAKNNNDNSMRNITEGSFNVNFN